MRTRTAPPSLLRKACACADCTRPARTNARTGARTMHAPCTVHIPRTRRTPSTHVPRVQQHGTPRRNSYDAAIEYTWARTRVECGDGERHGVRGRGLGVLNRSEWRRSMIRITMMVSLSVSARGREVRSKERGETAGSLKSPPGQIIPRANYLRLPPSGCCRARWHL